MAMSKDKAIKNIRKKLEKNVLLRAEMNNPYIEKYVDEAVIAIVDEIFEAIGDSYKQFEGNLRTSISRL